MSGAAQFREGWPNHGSLLGGGGMLELILEQCRGTAAQVERRASQNQRVKQCDALVFKYADPHGFLPLRLGSAIRPSRFWPGCEACPHRSHAARQRGKRAIAAAPRRSTVADIPALPARKSPRPPSPPPRGCLPW